MTLLNDYTMLFKSIKEIHTIRSGLLSLVSFQAVLNALTPFVNIYMSAEIINGISVKASPDTLIKYVIITVAANLIITVFSKALSRIITLFETKYHYEYEYKLNRKISEIDYANIENPDIHKMREMINQISNLNGGGLSCVYNSFKIIISSLFTIIFSISLTWKLFTTFGSNNSNPIIAIVTSPLASIFLFVAIMINVYISMHSNNTVVKKIYTIMNDVMPFNRIYGYYQRNYITSYNCGKDIRIYNQKDLISNEVKTLFAKVLKVFRKISNCQIKYSTFISLSAIFINFFIYLFVALKALAGLLGIGSVVKYVGSINQFINGFTNLMTQLAILNSNNEALRIYFDFINIPIEMKSGKLKISSADILGKKPKFIFKNVSFKYPSSDKYIFYNFSTELNLGERVAIVGENGSGKTTFIKLLCRLYDPTEGEILLNGINIKEYNYDDYISLFSVVFQDFKIFAFSLGENISASTDYNTDLVNDCIDKVGFKSRLNDLPEKLNTYLYKNFDENGIEISGGEAQKIALARALYKFAPIIILDEPTSALDPIAESDIYSNLNKIRGQNSVIFISHRLSSCRFCDKILVFDDGKIVQSGNHEELLANEQGKYYALWHAQEQYYKQ